MLSHPRLARSTRCRNNALGRIGARGAVQPGGDLGGQRVFPPRPPSVAHRFVIRSVGLDLGAIERDMAKADQPGPPAQQHLFEQPGQRLHMLLAEGAGGAEVRPVNGVTAWKSSCSSQPRAIWRDEYTPRL